MSKIHYNRIKAVLAEYDKSNGETAMALGVTPQTVSRWCTNKSQPKVEMLYEIAKWLRIDMRELLVSTEWKGRRKK